MSGSSAPPPGHTAAPEPVVIDLSAGAGGVKRLIGGRRGDGRITFTPQEITVEHDSLAAPLRFAPGSVVAAGLDPGAADVGKNVPRGRFPVLRRIGIDRIIPREEGIEGWLWTSVDGSAFTVLGDAAPNLAFLFSPPLSGETIEQSFTHDELIDLAKRSPLGQPAVFGLLVHAANAGVAQATLERYSLLRPLTDREIPPVQRRHLPDDKPANPTVAGGDVVRPTTSMPPPGHS